MIPVVLVLVGVAAVVAGVALWSVPAALIAAGVFALVAAALLYEPRTGP